MQTVELKRTKDKAESKTKPLVQFVANYKGQTGKAIFVTCPTTNGSDIHITLGDSVYAKRCNLIKGKNYEFTVAFVETTPFIRIGRATDSVPSVGTVIAGRLEKIEQNNDHDILTISGALVGNMNREFEISEDMIGTEGLGRVAGGITPKYTEDGAIDREDVFADSEDNIKQKLYPVLKLI